VAVLWGLRPSNSVLLFAAWLSSDCSFNSLNCSRKDCSSPRNEVMRSCALSFFAVFNSDLASSAYWSRVREKEVREADICPRREGVRIVPVGGVERSRLREVDCLSAVLKRVFWFC
jgi:hypothetical protein